MGSFDIRDARPDPQRIYFDLAYWYDACVPPAAPLSPDPTCLRVVEVPRPDRDMMPMSANESPLAWLEAALYAVAVLRGQVAADRLARAVRAAGMAGIEGYGLAWRATDVTDGVARFEIQPVVAALATLGLGAAAESADGLALWKLVARRRTDLGLDDADAAGIRLAPPSRPMAAFSLQCSGAPTPQALLRLRRVAHRAVERLLERHGRALARMPGYLGLDGSPDPDRLPQTGPADGAQGAHAAPVGVSDRAEADWDRMYEHWLAWHTEHPHRRPPGDSVLARWLEAQQAAARGGRLTRRRAEMLEESGVPLANC